MASKSFAVREFNVERRSIPLAIQTYFWQQISPLLKTKLEKKEYETASESLKNVICDNNLQGLPSAFKSVPRWFFVHSSLAYIVQCCGALLSNRHQLGYFDRLTNPERDLIYTLQWILLEAPGVCGIEDPENLLHPISTIELMVHLLVPHAFKIKDKDLINNLENGIALWKPLQNHQSPELPAFCHPVIYKDPNTEDFVSQVISMDNDSARNSRTSDVASKKSSPIEPVMRSATFFDVAVLRCLLSSGWCEEGVYWALIYIGDYLRREYDLAGAKEKMNFASASGTSWGMHGGADTGSLDSFGGCVLNDPVPPKPPDPTPAKQEVQINIINENDDDEEGTVNQADDTERKPEDVKITIEEDADSAKLIVSDDDADQNLTKLRISVDSPILDGRRPVFSVTDKTTDESKETCTDNDQGSSGQPYFSITITPSTPTQVDIVNEVNGSTNEGFDFNHKSPDNEDETKTNSEMNSKKDGKDKTCDSSQSTANGTKDGAKVNDDKTCSLESESGSTTCTTGYSNSTTSSNDSKSLDIDKTLRNHFTLLNSMGSSSELSLESVSSLGDQEGTVVLSSNDETVMPGIDRSISSITSLLESEDTAVEESEKETTPPRNKKAIQQQSSLSSDEPPAEAATIPPKDTPSKAKYPESKGPDHKSETASSDFPVSDTDKRSLVRDSSTETQDTVEAINLQPGIGNLRRSGRGLRDSMFRIEHYLVFPGVGDYVTTDGRLSIMVLLQAINGVLKENLSGRVCQMGLRVLELLHTIAGKEKEKRRASTVPGHSVDDRTVSECVAIGTRTHQTDTILSRLRTTFYGRPPTIHSLSSGCGFRLIRALGCPSGCGEGCHAYKGDIFRDQSNAYLASLHKQDETAFKSWLYNYARIEPVEDVVDFLHALVGFCDESPFAMEEEDAGSKTNKGKLFGVKEGVEGVILDAILKPLVSRVAEMKLTELDALTFYGELRQLLRYIKDNYGGVFWKVAMSGLMDCVYKGKGKEEVDAGTKSVTQTPSLPRNRAVKKEASISKADKMTPKATRRKFFKGQKFGRGNDGSENDLRALGMSSMSSNRTLDGTSIEETMSPRSKRKIFSLGAWRKQRVIGQTYDSDDDNLDDSPDTSMQQVSLKKKLFKERSRKRLDEVFPMKSGKKLINSSSSSIPDNGSPTVEIVHHEYERRPVDVEALRLGLIRFRFLMNASQPGAVPDPNIVAAMLDLEAPVVARGALLLECAHLVNRCNRGDWPTWLRGSHPSLSKRKANAPKEISLSTPRRNLVAMHEAGKLFHAWGVALGQKLEVVLKKKRQSMASIHEETGKKAEMLDDEIEEDFLDEGTLSESSQTCPYALKMIACQLLIEITAFLRESHGLYQIRRDSKGMQNRVRGRKSFGGAFGEKRRSTHFNDTHPNRLSGFFGGGGERIRKISAISQSSMPSEHSTTISNSNSPGRSSPHEPPPVIIFPDQEGKSADDSIILRRRASDVYNRERKLSDVGPDFASSPKRSSLHLPRSSIGSSSPKLNKSPRSSFSDFLGGGQIKKKRGTIKGKRASGPDTTPLGIHEDEDDSEDDETTRFPWLNAVTILNSFTSYLCDHQTRCPSNCHQRQTRLCARLVKALQNVYSGLPEKSEREKPDRLDKIKSKTGFNLTGLHIGSPQHSVCSGFESTKSTKGKPDEAMLDYIKSKLCGLTHCAFTLIAKAGTVVDRDLLEETLPVSWELLLDGDQQLVSAAASVFLLSGIRLKDKVSELLYKELTCSDPDDRVNSLLRYEVLWQSRYHAWPRLEEGASFTLRVPPPKVDFTLPSPPLGISANHAPDCPWDPVKMLEEQPGNQKSKNKDNKKVKEAEQAEIKRKQRLGFPLRTLPVSLMATFGSNDEDRAGHLPWFHLKWEQTIQGRAKDDGTLPSESTHQVNAELWPSALSSAIPHIIKLLDDVLVDSNKTAVMEVAYRIIWNCLVEDPILFFRTILEEITKKDKQEELVSLIRKLFMYVNKLPPKAAQFLLNNLVGVVMYYARTNRAGSQDSVALALSLTWELASCVRGLFFKDIKQSLKKEHCDGAMLIFANVPGTKKLAVTCCGKESMSERMPVSDEMTFGKVITYLKQRFNLNESNLYLLDTKSDQILEERDFVRDVFAFRKGFPSPQLQLEYVDYDKAFMKRQEQAFTNKLADIGRIMLCQSILKALPNQKQSTFLHEEFSRQTSFPRKALASDFGLYGNGAKGSELFGIDVIHKMYWVQHILTLLQCLPGDFPWSFADLTLFLNVINGALLLHCEDTAMIRLCVASLISISIHFAHIFTSDGFQFVFPSLLQVYAHHQGNEMVTQAIEFTMSQFYILHQKPCLLQLLASVAPILQVDTKLQDPANSEDEDPLDLVHPKSLFNLLNSLDVSTPDNLDILELVTEKKPLVPLDSCYANEADTVSESKVDEAIRLCVTVVDFAPESKRAAQMLVVLSAILPYYLDFLANESQKGDIEKVKIEGQAITSLSTLIKVLIKSSDVLTRSFVHFQTLKSMTDRTHMQHNSWQSTTSLNMSKGSISSYDGPQCDDDDEDGEARHGRPLLERLRAQEEKNEVMDALEEYRKPRNALLVLVADYVSICTRRVEEIRKILPPRFVIPDLLNDISIILLAEIMYSLMKLAVYDPVTMSSPGVQRYMLIALPLIDWLPEAIEPAVNLVLKRLSKIFDKLIQKPDLVRNIDWKALDSYVKGIYLVLCRQTYIAKSQYLKSLVTTCLSFVLEERPSVTISLTAFLPMAPISSPPPFFCETIMRLASRLMFLLKNEYTLQELCGGSTNFGYPIRTEKVFVRILLPILIRLGSRRPDSPKASPDDVVFAVKCFLRVVTTKNSDNAALAPARLSLIEDDPDAAQALSMSEPYMGGTHIDTIPDSLYAAAYLGLKVLVICFEDELSTEWFKLFDAISRIVVNRVVGPAFWDFIHFAVSYRTPLHLMLMPIIQTKVSQLVPKSPTERALKQQTIDRLVRPHHICNCKNAVIISFLEELKDLKENKSKKVDEEEEEGISLNPPPSAHQPGKRIPKTENEEDPASKPNKKTVTFFTGTKQQETEVANEIKGSNQDVRRKKWIAHKQPFLEESNGESTGDSSDSPFGHKRGTGYKVRKGEGPTQARKDRRQKLGMLPSSFSQDGELSVQKEYPEESEMKASSSEPSNLDQTHDDVSLEKVKEDLLSKQPATSPKKDSNLNDISTSPKRKSRLEKQESLPVLEEVTLKVEDTPPQLNASPVQARKMAKQETRAVVEDVVEDTMVVLPSDNVNIDKPDKLLIDNHKLDLGISTDILDDNVLNDEIKETTLDEKTLTEVDLDILSSGSSPSKYGMDESDEEFLDAMSEWPKEVALAMKRLNSPDVIKENDVEWDSDGIDDIIPMYPMSSTVAKRQLDGILSYSPPQHINYLSRDHDDKTFQSLAMSNSPQHTHTNTKHNETPCLDLPKPSPLPNGPVTQETPPTTRSALRSDSSPDVLESIKPSPPVDPSIVSNKRRSVPSYVIKINCPLDGAPTDNGPDQDRSRLWHRIYSGFDKTKPSLVPLASEEHIGSELSIVFGNTSPLDDYSRETNV